MASKAFCGRAIAALVVMLLCLIGAANCECGVHLRSCPIPHTLRQLLTTQRPTVHTGDSFPRYTERSDTKPSDVLSIRPGRALPVGSLRGRILRCRPGRGLRAQLLPNEPQLHGHHRNRRLHAGLRGSRDLQRRRPMRRPSPALNADSALPKRRRRCATDHCVCNPWPGAEGHGAAGAAQA